MSLSHGAHAPAAPAPDLANRLRRWRVLALVCLLAGLTGWPAWAQTEVTGFGSNPGSLRMFKHVPAGLPANAPLVVALHGCSQNASSYDDEPGWRMLAERWRFALLLPQQQSSNNSSACFNWFEPGDTARGQGEALSIKQMVDRMKADHGSDPGRVFVTGLSAGGAMAAVMLATYPDVFAGGAIVAGIPYRCATTSTAAFSCMNPGVDLSPQQWGDRVRAASNHAGPWPIVSIWHGDADWIVRPMNLTQSMQQWTNVHGIAAVPDVQDTVAGYPRRVYKDAAGVPRVETWTISGMGHGTPVDPGNGETQCGVAGAYILNARICSSYYIGRFWGLDNLDAIAPEVALVRPVDGEVVSGEVEILAVAGDEIGVDRVEFLLDGSLLGTRTAEPYSLLWDSTTATDGPHVLQARAFDLAGNIGTSAAVTVEVVGGAGIGTPEVVEFVNEDANDGYIKANADGSLPAVGLYEAWYGLAVGRGSDAKYNRSILSFDTSALPPGATIVSATLTVGYRSAYGNPWGNPAGNTLVVDVRTGCFGPCAIDSGDFSAAASANAVAHIPPFSGGSQASTAFSAEGLAAINRQGRTQLRLRFAQNQSATHYLWIGNGGSARLRVEYLP